MVKGCGVDASAQQATMFADYEEIRGSVKHRDDGRTFNSEISGRIDPRRHFETKFSMNHQRRGWAVTNNGKLSLNSPWK